MRRKINLTESCSSLSPSRVHSLPSNPLKSSLYLYLWKTKWLQHSPYMPQDIQGWCACTVLQSHFYFTLTQFRMWRKLEPSAVFFLSIHLVNESRGTTISAEVDEVEQEDGMKIQPVSVVFPNGNIIPPKPLDEVQPWEPIYKALAPTFLLCLFTRLSNIQVLIIQFQFAADWTKKVALWPVKRLQFTNLCNHSHSQSVFGMRDPERLL